MRPEPGGEAYGVSLSSLAELKGQAARGAAGIVKQLSDRLEDVRLQPGASIALVDGALSVMAPKGPLPPLGPLAGDLMARAAHEGTLEAEVEMGDPPEAVLARIEHFRPLGWSVVLLIPQSVVSDPVKSMAHRMAAWILLGALAAYLASSLLAKRVARPIAALAKRANQASELDFSSPEAEAFFSEAPSEAIGGEIGRLESAFGAMGRTIVGNVKELLSAAKAKERVDGELAAARAIQLGILPQEGEARLPGDLAAAFALAPAKEVGGDLYDIFLAKDGRVALVIGDVSGKGVPAALFMSMAVTLVRQALLDQALSPAEAMTRVNRHLTRHNPISMFVTLFVGLVDPQSMELEYANGGHCRPLAYGGPGGLRELRGLSGPMVGAIEGIEYEGFKEVIAVGESIALYTDGVTEAENEAGGFLGQARLDAAVMEAAEDAASLEPEALVARILRLVEEFRGEAPQSDDVCVLAFGPKRAKAGGQEGGGG